MSFVQPTFQIVKLQYSLCERRMSIVLKIIILIYVSFVSAQ